MAVLEEPIREVRTIRNYIDGEWVESRGPLMDVVNPVNCKVIARVPNSTREEFDTAVQAAKRAFPEWRETTPLARARCLFRFKELLEENFEELSRIQTQEHGKTIDESRGETRRGIEHVEVATGIPTFMMGCQSEDIATGIDEYLIRQPLGVFGIIGPFNFPFMIPLFFAPYAVATGNCIVIKPSSEVPNSQTRLAELAEEAGIPPGVWNIVHGGRQVVDAMIHHPDVKGVTFVGTSRVARDVIYRGCGETGKRVIAQGAAANFIVVMPDCNVEQTVPALMTSFFGNAGERCLAGQTLIIVGDDDKFYKDFRDAVVETARSIIIGNGLDEAVQMGPLRDKEKKDRVIEYIKSAVEAGARMLLDGRTGFKIRGDYPDTCFLGPTIFENVTPEMRVVREEIFGPTMGIMRTKDLDEAIKICNDNPFGQADAIFTSGGKYAREFQYRVSSGNVGINIGIAAPIAFYPIGGMKESFFGILHGQGQEAIRFFLESKVVMQRWP